MQIGQRFGVRWQTVTLRIELSLVFFIAFLITIPNCIAHTARVPKKRDLYIHGHRLNVRVYEPTTATGRLQPTIVFESGTGDGGDIWSAVITQLPSNLRLVTYDRPGIGLSEPDGLAPTAEHSAELLHQVLKEIAAPPFLLVGHSWGGPRIRTFAGMYPTEVAGLVLVDPTDFTMTTDQLKSEVFVPLGYPDGESVLHAAIARYLQKASPMVQSEYKVFFESENNGYSWLRHLPMPNVPLVVLLAQLVKPLPSEFNLPFDEHKYYDLLLTYRINSLSAFCRTLSEGTFVVTPNSAHYIQVSEPQLVAWAIDRVLHPDISRRLLVAFKEAQINGMREQLALLRKQNYAPSLTDESALNKLAYRLIGFGEKQAALALFTIIRQENPTSWNAYDSLAEAESLNGDKASAIRDYQQSLELNPKNEDARNAIRLLRSKPD